MSSSWGGEFFNDRYQEPESNAQVDTHANYGSITGGYTHIFDSHLFTAIDGRASYGRETYKSGIAGKATDSTPQYEEDIRLRLGVNTFPNESSVLSPYTGIGERLYLDDSKGQLTDRNFIGYDRRISQTYLPFGLTYKYKTSDHWTFSPNLEFDTLLYGKVDTRTGENNQGNANFIPNTENDQHHGYGIRGEFMVGQQMGRYAWQAGPFFRYWDIRQSNVDIVTNGAGAKGGRIEPDNKRTQLGLNFRVLF